MVPAVPEPPVVMVFVVRVPLTVVLEVPEAEPIPIVVVEPEAPAVPMLTVAVLPEAVIPVATLTVCDAVDDPTVMGPVPETLPSVIIPAVPATGETIKLPSIEVVELLFALLLPIVVRVDAPTVTVLLLE
jgi:hypothetical protein